MVTRQTATTTTTRLVSLLLVAGLAISLCSGGAAAARRKSKCSVERDLEMDVCASKIGFLGDHSFRAPKNLTATGAFCDQLKGSLACVQNYARDCLQGFSRQVLHGLMKRGKEQHSTICADDRAKTNFINKMACLADNKIEQLHRCMDSSVARFEYIAAKVSADNRLQGLCCSYQIFGRQLDSTMDGICPPSRAETRSGSAKEFVRKVAGATAGEFLQLICDGHRSMEDCKASKKTRDILPKLEEISAQASAGKIRNRNKSLVPVLLEILDSSS